MAEPGTEIRPALRDHLAVAWVMVLTLLNLIPALLWLPLSPLLAPWVRARARRALAQPPPPLAQMDAIPAADLAGKSIYVVAGEESGDRLLAALVRALYVEAPDVRVRGLAGAQSEAAGVVLDEELTQHASIGVLAVVHSIGFWWGLCARTLARWRADRPDLLLTVDFPGLNVRIARWARARGIRTVHLMAPQIWAHSPWRIVRWRRALDRLLAAYPFEPALLARSRIATHYVGHPLFESPLAPVRTPPSRPDPKGGVVELWPGSRSRELKHHVALLLEAAADIEQRLPGVRFRVPLAREKDRELFDALAATARRRPRHLEVSAKRPEPDARLMGALATSGTASAELGLAQVPMVVLYRLDPLSKFFSLLLLTAPWIALPNLVLGRPVVAEHLFWQRNRAPILCRDLLAVIDSEPAWREARSELQAMRERLESKDVARRAARCVLAELRVATR